MRRIAPLFIVVILSGCAALGLDRVDSPGDKLAVAEGTLHIAIDTINEAYKQGKISDELFVGEVAQAIDTADAALRLASKNLAIFAQSGAGTASNPELMDYIQIAADLVDEVVRISREHQ